MRAVFLPHAGLDGPKNCAGHHDANVEDTSSRSRCSRSSGSAGGGKKAAGLSSQSPKDCILFCAREVCSGTNRACLAWWKCIHSRRRRHFSRQQAGSMLKSNIVSKCVWWSKCVAKNDDDPLRQSSLFFLFSFVGTAILRSTWPATK